MKPWYVWPFFIPRNLDKVPAWENASPGFKAYYIDLCRHCYLTSRSPTRCYTVWTKKQIGERIGRCTRQIKRYNKYALDNFLLRCHYAGDSGTTTSTGRPRPPRYELPSSKGMINWWRWSEKHRKAKYHHRKEVKHEKENPISCPDRPPGAPRLRYHTRC